MIDVSDLEALEWRIADAVAARTGLRVARVDYKPSGRGRGFRDDVKVSVMIEHQVAAVTGEQGLGVTDAVFDTIREAFAGVYPVVSSHFAHGQEVAGF